jgi:putative peptide zinc metalloprotease protein
VPIILQKINIHIRDSEYIVEVCDKSIYLKIDEKIYFILQHINGKNTINAICNLYNTKFRHSIPNEVLYNLLFAPNGQLHILFSEHVDSEQENVNHIHLKHTLLSDKNSAFFTKKMSILFKPLFMGLNIGLLLALIIVLCLNNQLEYPKQYLASIQFEELILLGFCSAILSFWHELGHASACQYAGIAHGNIGFGFYLLSPVFYTDVTKIWVTNKISRIIVNIGGFYFEILLLNLFLLLFFAGFHKNFMLMIVLLTFSKILFSLNPFTKTDGYWVLSDLTGTHNLREKSNIAAINLFKAMFGKSFIDFSIRNLLLCSYSILSNLLIGILLFYTLFYSSVPLIKAPLSLVNWFNNTIKNYPIIDLIGLFYVLPGILLYLLFFKYVYKIMQKQPSQF